MGSESKRWVRRAADAIHAAGLDPALWRDIPGVLAQGWPGAKILVQGCSPDASKSLGFIQHGFEADDMDRYHQYYFGINPWAPVLKALPVMQASPSDETLPWWTFADSEFYNDFLKPQRDSEHGVAIKLFDEPGHFAWVGFQFGHSLADHYNEALPQALRQLAPALRNALALNRELTNAAAMATVEQVIGAFAVPAIIVNERGSVRAANVPATAALDRGDVVGVDPFGRLRLSRRDTTVAMWREIHRVCSADAAPATDIPIRSPEGWIGAVLSLFPLVLPPLTSHMTWFFPSERLTLLLLRDLATSPVVHEDLLRRLFDLTVAEARLAVRLATGETVAAAAAALGIGRETARSHLQAAFAKTGTHRQSELVALLARLPPDNRLAAGSASIAGSGEASQAEASTPHPFG